MIPCDWITEALERVTPHIRTTPLTHDPDLNLFIKWENHQVTGSFKVRGAFNKLLTLQNWERESGLVAASAGNHGLGVALAGKEVSAEVIIFVSENAVPSKVEAMQELGAVVRKVHGGYGEAESAGLRYAETSGAVWVSPYDDGQIIAGQATLGMEILKQLPHQDPMDWIIPVGGGGLFAGLACAVDCSLQAVNHTDSMRPNLVAVQSEASAFMHGIYNHGTQNGVIEYPSLADGLAGKIDHNSITIPIITKYGNEFQLVSEDQIKNAILFAWKTYGEIIEGSAAAALALALDRKSTENPSLVIITGGNIQPEIHNEIRDQFSVK